MRSRRHKPVPLHPNVTDETGHRYSMLTVIEYAHASSGKGRAAWLCRCECGNERIVPGKKLRQGKQISCGCSRAIPAIRQAARMKISARRRKQIALLGGRASAALLRQGGR